MSCPDSYNVCRVRGDTDALLIQLTTDGTTPIDITGSSFKLTVDPQADPSDALANRFQLTGTITDAPNGKVAFAPSTPQADQPPDTYYYDIQWTNAGGTIKTILKGEWKVQQDITK